MRDQQEKFCALRFPTREVMVGSVGVGGAHPVRIQSMTTSNTRDVEATGAQIIRLAEEGCEIARVTVQGKKEAQALEGIRNFLVQRGVRIPLVADVHFYPPAALLAADFVDKVRINPGNFVDKRAVFKTIEYDDASYQKELEKLEEAFFPLVMKCKQLHRAMRLGVNHGSLSDRILNRYGDTPQGMVASAVEFASVCRKYEYHDVIFSMKASNPSVMIQAYRLLVAKMKELGWDYPLHLGVTEAGAGEDGRIKSAMGIGSLLCDGIGDTIRVSLTEDPWEEISPCKKLIAFCQQSLLKRPSLRNMYPITGHDQPPPLFKGKDAIVVLHVSPSDLSSPLFFQDIGCIVRNGALETTKETVDALCFDLIPQDEMSQSIIQQMRQLGIYVFDLTETTKLPFHFVQTHHSPIDEVRSFARAIKPVVASFHYTCDAHDLPLSAGAEIGSLLCDRLLYGICITAKAPLSVLRTCSFLLLQAARLRMVKTDFISCPGCGRTLFDLQTTSARIREKTAHLPGVKIAIMGCIVNGPGEMADADFGYVGSKPGKIDLYVGKMCVEKDIDAQDADEKLIALIKTHGRWVEKESQNDPAVHCIGGRC